MRRQSYIIGVDEVGRGPLAGPVVVCAVAIPRKLRIASIARSLPLRRSANSRLRAQNVLVLRDSKKLSPLQRRAWVSAMQSDPRILHTIATVSPSVIDRINITRAANRAVTRALTNLLGSLPSASRVDVFLDGGLYANARAPFKQHTTKPQTKAKRFFIHTHPATQKQLNVQLETVIKGDETIPVISLASIIAKEYRDTRMRRAHKKFPCYRFDQNVGYGTKAHIAAIKKNGRSPLHRNSFLKKIPS